MSKFVNQETQRQQTDRKNTQTTDQAWKSQDSVSNTVVEERQLDVLMPNTGKLMVYDLYF